MARTKEAERLNKLAAQKNAAHETCQDEPAAREEARAPDAPQARKGRRGRTAPLEGQPRAQIRGKRARRGAPDKPEEAEATATEGESPAFASETATQICVWEPVAPTEAVASSSEPVAEALSTLDPSSTTNALRDEDDPDATAVRFDGQGKYTVRYDDDTETACDEGYLRLFLRQHMIAYVRRHEGEWLRLDEEFLQGVYFMSATVDSSQSCRPRWHLYGRDRQPLDRSIAPSILHAILPSRFLEKVISRKGEPVALQVGDASEKGDIINEPTEAMCTPTKLAFTNMGSPFCLCASLASCLASAGLGDTWAAARIFQHRIAVQEALDGFTTLQSFCNSASVKGWAVEKPPSDFDPVKMPSEHVTVLLLLSSNDMATHAITIYKDLIFDANHTHALPRCAESLHACIPGGAHYTGFLRAFVMRPQKRAIIRMSMNAKAQAQPQPPPPPPSVRPRHTPFQLPSPPSPWVATHFGGHYHPPFVPVHPAYAYTTPW